MAGGLATTSPTLQEGGKDTTQLHDTMPTGWADQAAMQRVDSVNAGLELFRREWKKMKVRKNLMKPREAR